MQAVLEDDEQPLGAVLAVDADYRKKRTLACFALKAMTDDVCKNLQDNCRQQIEELFDDRSSLFTKNGQIDYIFEKYVDSVQQKMEDLTEKLPLHIGLSPQCEGEVSLMLDQYAQLLEEDVLPDEAHYQRQHYEDAVDECVKGMRAVEIRTHTFGLDQYSRIGEGQDDVAPNFDAEETNGMEVGISAEEIPELCPAYDPDVELSSYLSRDAVLYDWNWVSDGINDGANSFKMISVPVWLDTIKSPYFQDKTRTFKYMRADLEVKITTYGMPQNWGSLWVVYKPFASWDDNSALPQTVNQTGTMKSTYYTELSQYKTLEISPQGNFSGKRRIPFFFPLDALRINNTSDTGPWSRMGRLYFAVVQDLQVLKDAGSTLAPSVSIIVSAHVVNPKLFGLTNDPRPVSEKTEREEEDRAVEVVTHARKPKNNDEYGKGIISKPASVFAHAARVLQALPIVAPYARASEIGLQALADVASSFGYCRPTVISTPAIYSPLWAGNYANVDAHDTSHKLTFDSKQETTVDPRTVGLPPIDEMTIAGYVQRMTYIDSHVLLSNGTFSHDIPVHPQVCAVAPRAAGFPGSAVFQPAGQLCLMFANWRGSMVYRFRVIASRFHRGKVRIQYDPNPTYSGTDATIRNRFTRIYDIADVTDFHVIVNPSQNIKYLSTVEMNEFAENQNSSTPGIVPSFLTDGGISNGIINLSTMGDITAPSTATNNDIYIQHWQCAGPDFEVANPTNINASRVLCFPDNVPNSNILEADKKRSLRKVEVISHAVENATMAGAMGPEEGNPDEAAVSDTMNAMPTMDMVSASHYGENVITVRELLKRYVSVATHRILGSAGGRSTEALTVTAPDIIPVVRVGPQFQSFLISDNNSITAGDTISVTGVLYDNPLPFFLLATFQGYRGGMRHKMISNRSNILNFTERFTSNSLGQPEVFSGPPALLGNSSPDLAAYTRYTGMDSVGFGGMSVQSPEIRAIQVEAPYYSPFSFRYTKFFDTSFQERASDFDLSSSVMGYNSGVKFSYFGLDQTRIYNFLQSWSAADDIQGFWQGSCPTVWFRQAGYLPSQ